MRVEHDRIAALGRPFDRRGRIRRHPHRRMRLLERFGQYLDVLKGEVAAVISDASAAPRTHDDLDRFAKSRIAFVRRHAKGFELERIETAAGAPIYAAAGQNIEER